MKILFDLLPVILFFVAYKLAGGNPEAARELAAAWLGSGVSVAQAPILLATVVAIVATIGQIAWVWARHRKVDTTLWISLAIILVFGGATLVFQNPTFIKWKPTALYWLFGCVLSLSVLLFRRNLIRKMLEAQVKLPDPVWTRLNFAWAAFFIAMGALNLYVAYNFSEETWVDFKLFGGMGLMLAFVLAQGFYLSRHIEEETT
ncbi:septation protein A [Aromatoleum sp.]|uniref:septation protein A n=1 Tax=Aromatoleum sp. TaxID=2307007 RepID=UPI002FCC3A79